MAKLIIENTNETIELPDGSSISEPCEEAGVPLACQEGVCGTCVINIKEGSSNLNPPTDREKDFLGDDTKKERLACQCKILKGSVKISF